MDVVGGPSRWRGGFWCAAPATTGSAQAYETLPAVALVLATGSLANPEAWPWRTQAPTRLPHGAWAQTSEMNSGTSKYRTSLALVRPGQAVTARDYGPALDPHSPPSRPHRTGTRAPPRPSARVRARARLVFRREWAGGAPDAVRRPWARRPQWRPTIAVRRRASLRAGLPWLKPVPIRPRLDPSAAAFADSVRNFRPHAFQKAAAARACPYAQRARSHARTRNGNWLPATHERR
ncbi:hypothetical protein GGX14DRAFT_404618 [Mycena pura]|uniref:Uncharacterized protein n=1 Tax=Mycena pura TaxID=153505 RepID=A0AAD6UXJ2_9AGAR|nr:hypothetical protein GGX14DRAFT_404618 [Mycena pura]